MRFRTRHPRLMRPTLTPEQARLLDMVEQAGSPKAAAEDLFRRLADLEAQVARLQGDGAEEGASEASPAAESPAGEAPAPD